MVETEINSSWIYSFVQLFIVQDSVFVMNTQLFTVNTIAFKVWIVHNSYTNECEVVQTSLSLELVNLTLISSLSALMSEDNRTEESDACC